MHGKPAGTVLAVEIELKGPRFTALNGGLQFKFNEYASSFTKRLPKGHIRYTVGNASV